MDGSGRQTDCATFAVSHTDRQKLAITIAAIAVASGLTIVIQLLHRNGFWIDELYTLHAIRLPWKDMILERLDRGHFPGYFLVVKSLYDTIGPTSASGTETLLRGFSITCWLT